MTDEKNERSKLTDEQRQRVIERIRERRRSTLKAIATDLGVSVSTVKRIEREDRERRYELFWTCAGAK